MPQLPYNQEVDARTGRSSGSVNAQADPTAFGYDQGKALQQSGEAAQGAGAQLQDYSHKKKEEKQAEDTANSVAKFDFSTTQQNIIDNAPADGSGLHDKVASAFDDAVSNYTKNIGDDKVRRETEMRLVSQRPGILEQATQHQDILAKAYSKDNTDQALQSLQNRAAINPMSFPQLLEQGKQVIQDTTAMANTAKSAAINSFTNDLTNRRFEGMLQTAKTPADLDGIALEMAGKDSSGVAWSDRFAPNDFHTLVDKVGSMKRSLQEHMTTATRAVLTSAKERQDKGSALPDDELQATQEQAKQSGDLGLITESARITRNNDIIKNTQRLPPAEQRARINAAAGNPGAAYPNTPPAISDAINNAATKFGVSAGYLGTLVHREYGKNLAAKAPEVDTKYAPLPAHGVDLRNMRSDVTNALTTAGKALGRPLPLMPGSGNVSANVPTIGMNEADKAKLVGSLVDSGFTGVADYGDHVHVDFREAVPQQFQAQPDGKAWGGWTYLSPEVTKVLKEKGFAAGADAGIIKRAAAAPATSIDYGKPTSIIDANGKPTSSAIGVGQFTEGTWLQMVKDPTTAVALGLNTQGKTDKELLALRADPALSVAAMAVYALKNQKTMENALGRPITDAELAMAHVMGATGATSFLTAYKNQPDQIAADLMPEAARANPGLFYDKDKAKTVSQVYNDMAFEYTLSPNKLVYEDNEQRSKILENTEKELKDDPIAHAEAVGSHVITPLSEPGGFKERGPTSMAVAQYYNIPMGSDKPTTSDQTGGMKPFTNDEANSLKAQIDTGDANTSLQVMANIQSMGEIPARAAMRQLEFKDPVFAHAGSLYLDGDTSVAGDIIRGRKMIVENPAVKDQMGADDTTVTAAFYNKNTGVGTALNNIDSAHRQAIQDAALAYLVQQQSSRGKAYKFDAKEYGKAVQSVLGGNEATPAIGMVNGHPSLLPKGISAGTMQQGLNNLGIVDMIKMSANGKPPRYADGALVNPADIKNEVMLQSIGAGQYRMMLEDGSILTTGDAQAYIFKPDAKTMQDIAARPASQIIADNILLGGM